MAVSKRQLISAIRWIKECTKSSDIFQIAKYHFSDGPKQLKVAENTYGNYKGE